MRITSVNDRALVRLISETHHKPPVLRGLVDSDEEADILAEIEGETSARLIAEREGSPALDRRELAFARRSHDLTLYGQSHINAAFTYTRPSGNRFNTGDRGAWYCAWEMLTSAQEVGFHRTRELGFIGRYEDEARYVELLADFIGDFPDLHPDLQALGQHPQRHRCRTFCNSPDFQHPAVPRAAAFAQPARPAPRPRRWPPPTAPTSMRCGGSWRTRRSRSATARVPS